MNLDIILVPDFEGGARLKFEYTTNLFLASWLEHESQISKNQLHLVCVGKPPTTTMHLADLACGQVTICSSAIGPDRYRNKLNGLNVIPTRDHFMLLDTDIVLLRHIDDIASRLDTGSIAIGYAGDAHLSLSQWRVLYERLGLLIPQQRIPMVRAAFGNQFSDSQFFKEISATLPYFNSGVVVAPWKLDLASHWYKLIDEVPRILRSDKKIKEPIHPTALLDQPPLAIAVEALRQEGRSVRILPDNLHARWVHFCLGLTDFNEVLIAHTTNIFRSVGSPELCAGVRAYSSGLRSIMNSRKPTNAQIRRLGKYADSLEAYLLNLYTKWIAASA